MDLTKAFSEDAFAAALQDWQWLGLEGLDPWFATAFGDVFFLGDDGVYWLDLTSGELTCPFPDPEQAKRTLATEKGMDEFLLAGLAFAAAEAGLEPGEGEVLAYREPPILDGEFEVSNLVVADFVATVAKAGRLHEALDGLPDGAEVPDDLV